MKTKRYKININTTASKVYNLMLGLENKKTYEAWTALFDPTSTYEGSWDKGSKMLFVGTDEQGKKGGMIAEIAENIPNKFISIKHYGIIENDQEILDGPKVKSWAGSMENYTFSETNGVTTITVEVDSNEEYIDYFDKTWPKALDKLKALSES
ncbi:MULTISPECIES: SRPBCC domain-containing protein [unclassified Arenibacter]|uniref:SRPBCC domain-containing protein n=1 Tax=unclassified Arenibacter TaxID=2615047 RepID=UPI000E342B55|nr:MULTISPECIES: SRPBCC domain-containing protein [unclassified Arenibacter]MCM4165343.1 tungsten formylmethanofuran dehydrogenase [Arenibacter sp. A80]RFT55191.1 SRPBCC domain-containing protein [Arenibacter sp. P308M17]